MKPWPRLPLALLLALAAVSPHLSQAQTIVTLGTQFEDPSEVALDGAGNIYLTAGGGEGIIEKLSAASGYTPLQSLGNGLLPPVDIAVDSQGNLFTVSGFGGGVQEILAAGGYTAVQTIGSGFVGPAGVALDSAGNVFVTDDGTVKEILAAGGYTTVNTLAGSFVEPLGVAVDRDGNVFVADIPSGTVSEIPSASGYATVNVVISGLTGPTHLALDGNDDIFVTANSQALEVTAATNYTSVLTLASGFGRSGGIAVDASGNVFITDGLNGLVEVLIAADNYATVNTLGNSFNQPGGITIDHSGDLFIADTGSNSVKEFPATGGYKDLVTVIVSFASSYYGMGIAVDTNGDVFVSDMTHQRLIEIPASSGGRQDIQIAPSLSEPGSIAIDGNGNLFVDDFHAGLTEIPAAGGYSTTVTLPFGRCGCTLAADAGGDLFVAVPPDSLNAPAALFELTAADGYATTTPLAAGAQLDGARWIAIDSSGNLYVTDVHETLYLVPAAGGYVTARKLYEGSPEPNLFVPDGQGDVYFTAFESSGLYELLPAPPSLLAAVLPDARSVQLGETATIFATLINAGPTTLDACQIGLRPTVATTLTLSYQTTDPTTNALTGTLNTPVAIPGNNGTQSFLIAFQDTVQEVLTGLPLDFHCVNGADLNAAAVVPGVTTVDLSFSAMPVADVIALVATATQNGIVEVPDGGVAAFAVASINVGATEALTLSANTGTATLPVALTICLTDPTSGQCLTTPAPTVSLQYTAGAAPTFSVFLQSSGAIPFDPAASRVYLRFTDIYGDERGMTSVAIETN